MATSKHGVVLAGPLERAALYTGILVACAGFWTSVGLAVSAVVR